MRGKKDVSRMSGYRPSYFGPFPVGTEVVLFAMILREVLGLTWIPDAFILGLQ